MIKSNIQRLLPKWGAQANLVSFILLYSAILEMVCGFFCCVGVVIPFALTLEWNWDLPLCGLLLYMAGIIEAGTAFLCAFLYQKFLDLINKKPKQKSKTYIYASSIIIVIGVIITWLSTMIFVSSLYYGV